MSFSLGAGALVEARFDVEFGEDFFKAAAGTARTPPGLLPCLDGREPSVERVWDDWGITEVAVVLRVSASSSPRERLGFLDPRRTLNVNAMP